MPNYRLVFPVTEGTAIENAETGHIDSGDTIYEVGAEIEYDGKRWRVTQIPLEEPMLGMIADIMVWPVE